MKQYLLKLFIVFSIFSVPNTSWAIPTSFPDSLRQVIQHNTIDENAEMIIQAIQNYSQSNTFLGVELGNLALEHVHEAGTKARITKSLAVVYYTSGNKIMADSLFYEALIVFDSLDMTQSKAEVYNNMGLLYYDKQNYEQAISYLHQAQEINHILGDTASLVKNLSNLSLCYNAGEKYKEALQQLNEAYQLALAIDDTELIASILTNMGELYHSINNHRLELEYLRKALGYTYKLSNNFLTAHIYLNLAKTLMEQGMTNQVLSHLNNAFELASTNGFMEPLRDVYYQYSNFHEQNHEPVAALDYYKKYQLISDSLDAQSEAKKINAISSKYAHEKQLRQQELLKNEALKKEQQMNRRTTLIVLLSVILILVLALFTTLLLFSRKTLKLNETLNKQKTELQNLNQQKDEFFSFVAHDLKNPMGNILGFTELLGQRLEKNDVKDFKRYTHQIRDSAKSLNELIDNLLDWSRLTRGKIKFEPEIIDVPSIIRDVYELYKETARKRNITIVNDIHGPIEAYADKQMVLNICKNLMSNAIKYNKDHGHIHISTRIHDGKVELRFKDTGIGIKSENINKLFRIDVKKTAIAHHENNGGGLGLILTKEMVTKNSGEIFVESSEGEGSTFAFTLPQPSKEIKDLLNEDVAQQDKYLHQLKEYKDFPDEVKNEITHELMPQYKKIRKILSVEDLIGFSEKIIRLGKSNQIKPFEDYGHDLLYQTRALKFDKILILLPVFEHLTELILNPTFDS